MQTMPNNILVGSEKLFRTKAPWRIENSYLGQMTKDHEVILFNHDPQIVKYSEMAKKLARTIALRADGRSMNRYSFIGYEYSCRLVSDLYVTCKYEFDTAIFINNPYDDSFYQPILGHTKIYNIYTKKYLKELEIQGAEVNEYVSTLLPAHMSNKVAQTVSALMIYDSYDLNYLSPVAPVITYV